MLKTGAVAVPEQQKSELYQFLLSIGRAIDDAINSGAVNITINCSLSAKDGEKCLNIKFEDNVAGEKFFTCDSNDKDRTSYQVFSHEMLKDYILWFTKFGSPELALGKTKYKDVTLLLKGLGREAGEKIPFGHVFPPESNGPEALFEKYAYKAPQYYCKKYVKTGVLQHFPEIDYEAVIYIEGDRVKAAYNPMLMQEEKANPNGAYHIRERYGLWLCKDYIPVQRKNEWIVKRLLRTTDYHAFFNCQALMVSESHNSIADTSKEILQDIEQEIKKITSEIAESDDQNKFEWLVHCVCSGL